ncbi:ganglioside-induced differentiation-associated protein 1-like [Ptychodera flava]|uniref:ganglioside-induced differentiation-associated protein 1-like n=1 Tax=Ptychodera flava TaxID=63121 RepID=UPI00396A3509
MESEAENQGVTLYINPIGYYAVRAMLALEFKNIPFNLCFIKTTNMEHLQPWFVKLNPHAKIPVMVHRKRAISDSRQILEYIDSELQGSGKLYPEKGSAEWKRVQDFQDLIDSFYMGDLVGGCYKYPAYVPEPDPGPMDHDACTRVYKYHNESIRYAKEMAAKHPELKEIYETKSSKTPLCNPTEDDFQDLLRHLQGIFDFAESELKSSQDRGRLYIVGDKFSAGDIYLLVFLKFLGFLGFSSYWRSGNHPFLERYFEEMQKLPSCSKILNDYEARTTVQKKSVVSAEQHKM